MKKREMPKPILKKKVMKAGFWTLFFICLFLSVVAIARVSNSEAATPKVVQPKPIKPEKSNEPNKATAVGAQTFAKNFTDAYLTWSTGSNGAKVHATRLKPFLAKGLDEQAGVRLAHASWSSQADGIQIVRVKQTGSHTATLIVRVDQTLSETKTIQPTDKNVKPKKQKPQTKTIQKGPYEKYLAVPVKTDGHGFAVFKIPHFVSAPKPANISVDEKTQKNPIQDETLHQDIALFLTTFFKVYTTGKAEQLLYYTKMPHLRPLTGVVTYKSLDDLNLYPTNQRHTYQLTVNVTMAGSQDLSTFVYPYQMTIQEKDHRWFVTKMKGQ